MANKTNCTKNGVQYFRIVKVVGHKMSRGGYEIPVKKEFYGKSKKEAELKYNEYMKRRALNIDSSKQYFGIMADKWLYNFLAQDHGLKPGTKQLYISTWNLYVKPLELYHLKIEEINAGMIQETYNKMHENGVPTSAIKTINKVMSRFYNYLVQQGYTPFNYINTLSLPKEKFEEGTIITTWTKEELNTILNSFEKAQNGFRLRFLLILASYTGMRISELLGLKYSDIEESKSGYIVNVKRQVNAVTSYNQDGSFKTELAINDLKSKSSFRSIPVPGIVIKELKSHKAKHLKEQIKNGYRTEYIFTTNTGGFVDVKNARRSCERYYKAIGIPAKGFHTYRHTFGTNLYKNGVPLKTASDLLGHKDINITARYYIGTGEEEKRKAIEILASVI